MAHLKPTASHRDVYWTFQPAMVVSQILGVMTLKGVHAPLRNSLVLRCYVTVWLVGTVVVAVLVPHFVAKQNAGLRHVVTNTTTNTTNTTIQPEPSNYFDASQSIAILVLNPLVICSMAIASRWTTVSRSPSTLPLILTKLDKTDALLNTSRKHHRKYFLFTLFTFGTFSCVTLTYFCYYVQKGAQAMKITYTCSIALLELCKSASLCTDLQFTVLLYLVKGRFGQVNARLTQLRRLFNDRSLVNNATDSTRSDVFLGYFNELPNKSTGRKVIDQETELKRRTMIKNKLKNTILTVSKQNTVFHIQPMSVDNVESNLSESLATLCLSHQNLCDAINDINRMFGVQLLVSMSGCFTNGLLNLYFSLYGFTSSDGAVGNEMVSLWGRKKDQMIGSLAQTAYYGVRFLILTCIAASTISEINRGTGLVSALNRRQLEKNAKEELQIFICHMTSQRPVVTACGFFNLEMSLITSALAAWSTYLVIMAQMHGSK